MSKFKVGDRARVIKVIDIDSDDRNATTDPVEAAKLNGGYGPSIGDIVEIVEVYPTKGVYEYNAKWVDTEGYEDEDFGFLGEELELVK
ncbi:hypothetical protein SEA_PENELOPE2018_52 [Mycobacterium phage Penelope2018]|uniref:Uncharacterized protein n=3 Tax=Plotvirus plot TaxID=2170099 RepID=A0A5P8DAH5_9CAUD|nr:hypothetical protein SEA_DELTON_53 [Mycobacterium phage Delton]QEA11425.1 hypothetical protein SEA_PENELOPE2018_52 [Mycobacterium phage Penelope2018]QFP95977.1 hypothetical protein SEA_HELPFUL_55 [Mycobacterium phage Helpful]